MAFSDTIKKPLAIAGKKASGSTGQSFIPEASVDSVSILYGCQEVRFQRVIFLHERDGNLSRVYSSESYTFCSRRIMSTVVFPLANIAVERIPAPGNTEFLEATSPRADIRRHSLAISRRSTESDRLF